MNYQCIFENSAVPILYIDYSDVKKHIDKLKLYNDLDFRTYFDSHKNEINQFFSLLKVLEINKKGIELFEVECKENCIENILKHFTESSYNALREVIILIYKGVSYIEHKMPIHRFSGGICILQLVISVVNCSKSNISNVIVTLKDTTEQDIVENALRESKSRITNILSSIEDTFFSLDEQWRFTDVNPTAVYAPLSRPSEELTGRVMWELYPQLEGTEIQQHYFDAAQNHTLEHFETKSPLNGRWYEVFIKGRKNGVDVYMRDITKHHEYENILAKKNEELEKVNDIKNKFFSIIAHDLKNPFISLIGASDLLLENVNMYDYNKIEKLTRVINDSAKCGYNMVMNMLEWAKSQSGNLIFNLEEINLKDLIFTDLSNTIEYASLKNIKIIFKINSDTKVYADKNLLKSVFRNLINNALKYTPNGGMVTIGTKNKNGNVTIYINDTGIGIERCDLDKIFRSDIKFCRPGTNHEQGSGIGLVLCKEFIEKHGGKIWVTSEVDKGSTFYFSLSRIVN